MGPRDSDTGEQSGQWNCPSPEHPGADRRPPTPRDKTKRTLNTKRWWCHTEHETVVVPPVWPGPPLPGGRAPRGSSGRAPGTRCHGQKTVPVDVDRSSDLGVNGGNVAQSVFPQSSPQQGVSAVPAASERCRHLATPRAHVAEGPRSAPRLVWGWLVSGRLHSRLVLPGPRPDGACAVAFEEPVLAGAPKGQGRSPLEHLEVSWAAGPLPARPRGAAEVRGAGALRLAY